MGSKEKLVSIGLATHNGQSYLREALDSLLAQTYRNFELVISDNASTDDTPRICEEYAKKDRRIKYIRQRSNIGHARNFEYLKKNARGEYFIWASDDDKRAPTFVERCIAALDADKEAIAAISKLMHFDDLGRTQKEDPKLFFTFKKDLYGRLKEFILLTILGGKGNMTYGVWRREKIVDCKFIDKPFLEYDFLFRCLVRGHFTLVDEILFYKRTKIFVLDPNPRVSMRIKRVLSNIKVRFVLFFSPLYFPNMIFILRLKSLKMWDRIKLIFWNLVALLRLFVWYKV
ncbi:MAG: glycosyltransferase [Candidatus Liptonbacteria bacterium]|nr:glycosyltransferase [Candidatus Liptonbacteria bacterium]